MNNLELQIAAFVARYAWAASLIGFGYLMGIWRAYRTKRYARELLARSERQHCEQMKRSERRSIERLNEQQKLLLRNFFAEGQPTLDKLADDTESDFRVR